MSKKNGRHVACDKCGKVFYRCQSAISDGANFCSKACVRNGQEIKCLTCGKMFYRRPLMESKE